MFKGWTGFNWVLRAATFVTLIPLDYLKGLEHEALNQSLPWNVWMFLKCITRKWTGVGSNYHKCQLFSGHNAPSYPIQSSDLVYCSVRWWSSEKSSPSADYQSSDPWMLLKRKSRVLFCPIYGLKNGFSVSNVFPQKLQRGTTWCPLVVMG